MNSAELIKALSLQLELSKSETERRLGDLTAILSEELQNDKTLSILNFGNFDVKKRNERVTVHPGSGKRMLVPPKLVLKYKPATALNAKVKSLKDE